MKERYGEYEIDTDFGRVDFERVTGWLGQTYWSPGVSRELVERGARGSSMVVGAYGPDRGQVGYLRVVSDKATFAWVADVWVDEGHRKRGVARAMVGVMLREPGHQGLRRWMLLTRDAHPLYRGFGFEAPERPEWVMVLRPGGKNG